MAPSTSALSATPTVDAGAEVASWFPTVSTVLRSLGTELGQTGKTLSLKIAGVSTTSPDCAQLANAKAQLARHPAPDLGNVATAWDAYTRDIADAVSACRSEDIDSYNAALTAVQSDFESLSSAISSVSKTPDTAPTRAVTAEDLTCTVDDRLVGGPDDGGFQAFFSTSAGDSGYDGNVIVTFTASSGGTSTYRPRVHIGYAGKVPVSDNIKAGDDGATAPPDECTASPVS